MKKRVKNKGAKPKVSNDIGPNGAYHLITFNEIGGWYANLLSKGTPGLRQAYAIHTASGLYVAYLGENGDFRFVETKSDVIGPGKIVRTFEPGLYPDTGELEQAVRLAYLMLQESKK